MEFEEEEIIELSEEEVLDDDDSGDYDGDEWVEETQHSEREVPPGRGGASKKDGNIDDQVDDEVEEEEFVDEEYDEEVEEVWDEDDALSDEQFLNQLHRSFQEMAKKHNHQSSARSNSLASIKEEDTAFAPDVNGSDHTGSFSVDESASVDFDLGSYQDDMSESSHDEPLDYEQACRNLIALVYQGESVDADDIIRRCDLNNLYKNLKQQHKHLLKSIAQKEDENSPWESFNLEITGFTSNTTNTATTKPPEDWIFDDTNDLWGFKSVQNTAPPTDNAAFDEANRLPKGVHQTELPQVVTEPMLEKHDFNSVDTTKQERNPRQVEKWLERDADDPDDYEYACRTLIAILYNDDEDHDPDTMLRRSHPKDLYRYLKNEYWFLEHTGLIDEKVATKGVETAKDKPPMLQDMIRSIKRDSKIQVKNLMAEGGKNQLSDCQTSDVHDTPVAAIDVVIPSNETNEPVSSGLKVEKWLERNADDPEDFELACRKLALFLYKDDEDYDVNTMLRRTSPEDLYRYLSNEYWYQVRKGGLVNFDLDAIKVEHNTLPERSHDMFTSLERQLSARTSKDTTETEQRHNQQPYTDPATDNASKLPPVVSPQNIDVVPYVRCGSSGSVDEHDGKSAQCPQTSAKGIEWPPEVPEDSAHNPWQQGTSWNTLDVGTTNDGSSVESTGIPHQSWSDTYERPLGDGASAHEVTRSLLDPSMSNHDSVEHSIDDEESLSDDIVIPDKVREIETGSIKNRDNNDEENTSQNSGDSHDETSAKLSNWEVVGSGNQQKGIVSPTKEILAVNPKTSVYDLDFAKRLEIIKEEMLLLIRQAEIEELDESFEQFAVNALVLAAQKVAYRKKYYDVLSDRFVFFPPIVKTIMDYSLFDMIEQEASHDFDCLPDIYSASLRSIADKHLVILQLDFDYMDKLGIPIEDILGGPLGYCDGQTDSNSIDNESNSHHSASTSKSKKGSANFEGDKLVPPFYDDENDNSKPGNFRNGDIEAREKEDAMSSNGTEGPPSLGPPIDEDDLGKSRDENEHDSNMEGSGTDEYGYGARQQDSSTRFREMSQILEFKRRIDKARLSEEADSLQKMRNDFDDFLLEGMKRLDEERNVALEEIEDSAKLLEQKYNSDVEEIQRKLEGLKATRQTAEQEITSRFQELEEKRNNFVAQQASAREAKRLSEQVILTQKQDEVLKRLLTAQLTLETEREAAEDVLLESMAVDQGKAVGLFGVFGQRKRNMELEKQKQRQMNFMQWKVREIELEKEIADAKVEQAALVEQLRKLEQGSKESDFELEERKKSLEEDILSEEQVLLELSKVIDRKFVEGEMKLAALKNDLDLMYSQDTAWVSSERNVIESKYKDGLLHLAEEEKRRKERLIQAENKINAKALALKEKWLREETALAKESKDADIIDQRSVVRVEYSPSSLEVNSDKTHEKIQSIRDRRSNEGKLEHEFDEVAVHETLQVEAKGLGDTLEDQPGAKSSGYAVVDVNEESQQEYAACETVATDVMSPQSSIGTAEKIVHGVLPVDSLQVEEVRNIDDARVAEEIPQGSIDEATRQESGIFEGGSFNLVGESLFVSAQHNLLVEEKQEKSRPNQNDQTPCGNDGIEEPVQGWATSVDVPIKVELIKGHGDDFTSTNQAYHDHGEDTYDAEITTGEIMLKIAILDAEAGIASRHAQEAVSSVRVQDDQLRGQARDDIMESKETDGHWNHEGSQSSTLRKELHHQRGAEESICTEIEHHHVDIPIATETDGYNVEESQLSEREVMWEVTKPQVLDSTTEGDARGQAETDLVSQGALWDGELLNGEGMNNVNDLKRRHNENVNELGTLRLAHVESACERAEFYYPLHDEDSNQAQKATTTTSPSSKEIKSVEDATVFNMPKRNNEEGGNNDVSVSNVISDQKNANESQKDVRISDAFAKAEQLEVDPRADTSTSAIGDGDSIGTESGSRLSNDDSSDAGDTQNQGSAMDISEIKQLDQSGSETKVVEQCDGADDLLLHARDQESDLFNVQTINKIDSVGISDTHQSWVGRVWENPALVTKLVRGEGQSDVRKATAKVAFNADHGDDFCSSEMQRTMVLDHGSVPSEYVCQVQQEKPTTLTLSDDVTFVCGEAGDDFETNDERMEMPSYSTQERLPSLDGVTFESFLVHAEGEAHEEIRNATDADGDIYRHNEDMNPTDFQGESEESQVQLRAGEGAQAQEIQLVDDHVASEGVVASSHMEENSFRPRESANSGVVTILHPEGDVGINAEVVLTPSSDKGEAVGGVRHSSAFTAIPEIEHHKIQIENAVASSTASISSADLVPSSVSPESANTLESSASKRHLGATHKRKHKPGGGLAGRLLEEAQHFLESSAGSFSHTHDNLSPVDNRYVDNLVIIEDEAQASPLSPTIVPINPKVLVLLSRTATTRAQEKQQDKALVFLQTCGIDLEVVDGSDLSHKALRDSLFVLSGLRGAYPQIFVQTNKGEFSFFGSFAELESANEAGQLVKCLEQCSSTIHENQELPLERRHNSTEQTIHKQSNGLESFQVQVEGNSNNDRQDSEQALHPLQSVVVSNEYLGSIIEASDSSMLDVGSTNGSRSETMAAEPVGIDSWGDPVRAQGPESNSWAVTRLEWWRQNGKRLVDEKLTTSTQAHGVNATGNNSSSASSSLVEKRRLIAERRQRALLARAQIVSPPIVGNQHGSHESGGNAGGKDEENLKNQNEVKNEDKAGHITDDNLPRASGQTTAPVVPTRASAEIKDIDDNRMAGNDVLSNERMESGQSKEVGNKSLGVTQTSLTISSLDEKRRKAAEARARAMAARGSPRVSSLSSSLGTRVDKSDDKVEGSPVARLSAHIAPSLTMINRSDVDAKRAERMAEAKRLSLKSARAREARLAREAQLLAKSQQADMVKADEQMHERKVETESLSTSVSLKTEVNSHEVSQSSIVPQMIREADRLATFIVRYEKKLEAVCRSLIEFAQKHEGDEEAENVQKSPLPEMYRFLRRRDWFRRHAPNVEAPQLFLVSSNENVPSFEERKVFSVDSCLQLTPLGSSFLSMDGQQESELGRFLLSIRQSRNTMNGLRQHWADLAHRESGDSLARKIEGRLDQLVSFGLDTRLITAKES